jgi:hypothetical protein
MNEWKKDQMLFSAFSYAAILAKSGNLKNATEIFWNLYNTTEFGSSRAKIRRVASLFGIEISRLEKK